MRPEDELRDAIVSGRLQPNERLIETDLARALGVGRSAVRTALVRLEQEGLVQQSAIGAPGPADRQGRGG